MYVPVTPVQPAARLAPVGVGSVAPAVLTPARTRFTSTKVRKEHSTC